MPWEYVGVNCSIGSLKVGTYVSPFFKNALRISQTKWLLKSLTMLLQLLLVCTCAYIRSMWPSLVDRNKTGILGTFWKCARYIFFLRVIG
jgi:hypothetical protein